MMNSQLPRPSDERSRRVESSRETLADGDAPCITSSFQAECVVLTHMLREVQPDIPVLFLDTFHHFPQTLAYRDELTSEVGTEPDQPAGDGAAGRAVGSREHAGLLRAAQGGAAVLGARRATTPGSRRCAATSRRRAPTCRRSSRSACRAARRSRASRRSPAWTARDVWKYAKDHDIPLLPLYDSATPASAASRARRCPLDPDNPRSGRWHGQKLECGIHIQAK